MRYLELNLKVWASLPEIDRDCLGAEVASCLQHDGSLLEGCAVDVSNDLSSVKEACFYVVTIVYPDARLDAMRDHSSLLREMGRDLNDYFRSTYDESATVEIDVEKDRGLMLI